MIRGTKDGIINFIKTARMHGAYIFVCIVNEQIVHATDRFLTGTRATERNDNDSQNSHIG